MKALPSKWVKVWTESLPELKLNEEEWSAIRAMVLRWKLPFAELQGLMRQKKSERSSDHLLQFYVMIKVLRGKFPLQDQEEEWFREFAIELKLDPQRAEELLKELWEAPSGLPTFDKFKELILKGQNDATGQ